MNTPARTRSSSPSTPQTKDGKTVISQFPHAHWADTGETPTMLVQLGWGRFRLFARTNSAWTMSGPLTAQEASRPNVRAVIARQPVGTGLARWIANTYTDMTGE